MLNEEIVEILKDWNPWAGVDLTENTIERDILLEIEKVINSKEIVVLKGIRRAGKSTLLYQIINKIKKKYSDKNVLYVNFEDPKISLLKRQNDILDKILESYLQMIEPRGKYFVFFDEIQNIKNWELWVRKKRDQGIKIFITGSSSKMLLGEISYLLTGRNLSYEIFPFSFKEILKLNNINFTSLLEIIKSKVKINKLFSEYMKYGGFPEICLQSKKFIKEKLLKQYFEDIIFKDIAIRYNIRNITSLKELSVFLLTNIGNKISYNKVAINLGIDSVELVKIYIQYLIECYLINEVKKFSYAVKKQSKENRKIYTYDLGLRNSVAFDISSNSGCLLENIVFIELKRQEKEIFYFEELNEVDFIVKKRNNYEIINVCYSLKDNETKKREIKSLKEAMQKLGEKKAMLITREEEGEIKEVGLKINIIPAWKWLINQYD